jgi:hypothetical protein
MWQGASVRLHGFTGMSAPGIDEDIFCQKR